MLILCTWVNYPMLHAQIYTTSSARYKSCSSGGSYIGTATPTISDFRSTSTYIIKEQRTSALHTTHTPVQLQLANGTIRTAASALGGGELAQEPSASEFVPTNSRKSPGDGGLPPPDLPLGDSWQVWLLMALLYSFYCYRKQQKSQPKNTSKILD